MLLKSQPTRSHGSCRRRRRDVSTFPSRGSVQDESGTCGLGPGPSVAGGQALSREERWQSKRLCEVPYVLHNKTAKKQRPANSKLSSKCATQALFTPHCCVSRQQTGGPMIQVLETPLGRKPRGRTESTAPPEPASRLSAPSHAAAVCGQSKFLSFSFLFFP